VRDLYKKLEFDRYPPPWASIIILCQALTIIGLRGIG